jgi:VanZ family protein
MPKLGRRGAAPRSGTLVLALIVAAILLLTLWPLGAQPTLADARLSVRFGLADSLRNVILFLPLGIALSRRGASAVGVALRAALLSAGIELLQIGIPGRYANVSDFVSNTTGAILGAILYRSAAHWLWPGPRAAARLAVLWAAAIAAAFVGTAVLLRPVLPETEYWAGWTLELAHLDHYTGRVTSAALGPEPLPSGRLERSAEVRRLWLDGAPLRVEVLAGATTASLAPVFTIHDEAHREVLLLGEERGDLVLRVRTGAQAVSLDRPALRWPGVLANVREGEPLAIGARREGNGWCLSLGDESACPLGFTAGSGWRLIWFPQVLPPDAVPWLNALWLGALFVPLGLWLRLRPSAVLAMAIAVGALFAAPRAGLLPTAGVEIAAASAGLLLGLGLRALLASQAPARRLVLGAGRAHGS